MVLVLEIKGLNKENIISISNHKGEDSWVKDYRLEAYKQFERDKSSKGSKAWDDIEEAYYEMIAKDYNIIIY